jgi:UDP-GlcNAc:undecaprenyl-phosphate GlcNAc-1-phosphate transferase
MVYISGFIVAMLLTMVFIPPVKQLGYRFGLIDTPNQRKVHVVPIPRVGGVAMILGATVPLILWLTIGAALSSYLLGASLIIIFGILDDAFDLNFKLKFGVQIAAAIVVAVYGDIQITHFSLFGQSVLLPPPFSIPLTVFFILAVVNAVNFADGLDGLAGGITLLSLIALAGFAYESGDRDVLLVSVVLTGSVMGFLLFNSHPAQVFMGDGGSQFLGFSLAVMSVYLTQQENSGLSAFLPLLIIGMPLIDLVYIIVSRKLQGKSLFLPDKGHIHHQLLGAGLRQYGSVFVIYLLQSVIVIAALVYRNEGDTFVVALFLLFLFTISAFVFLTGKHGHLPGASLINRLMYGPVRRMRIIVKRTHLQALAKNTALIAIVAYLVLGTLVLQEVTFEVGMIAAGLWSLFFVLRPRQVTEKLSGWFIRFVYYLTASGVLFLMYTSPEIFDVYRLVIKVFFSILAVVIFIAIEYSGDKRLEARPIDFLVVTTALILPGVVGLSDIDQVYWFVAAHLLVLFYGVELVLLSYRNSDRISLIQYLYTAPLLVLAVRGLSGI